VTVSHNMLLCGCGVYYTDFQLHKATCSLQYNTFVVKQGSDKEEDLLVAINKLEKTIERLIELIKVDAYFKR